MHICADELRWIPFLVPALSFAVTFGRGVVSRGWAGFARVVLRRKA